VQLAVDVSSQIARVGAERLDLTPTEFRLLEVLIRHPARAFSRAELLEVALPDSDALERAVDTHLKNLRRKLEELGLGDMLETVRGTGYRLWGGV
jgi:two-component system, OmpR family, response regulator AdeR